MNLELLRRETSAAHQSVERALPLMSPSLNREAYIACLLRLHGVVAAYEHAAPAAGDSAGWMQGLLETRKRLILLEQDLTFFRVAPQDRARPALPAMSDAAGVLGAMYVMEGSTLGGQIIARHVEEFLALQPAFGTAYFRGYGVQTGPMWKEFCEVLRSKVAEEDSGQVVQAAQEMFAVFEHWMRRVAYEPPSSITR